MYTADAEEIGNSSRRGDNANVLVTLFSAAATGLLGVPAGSSVGRSTLIVVVGGAVSPDGLLTI